VPDKRYEGLYIPEIDADCKVRATIPVDSFNHVIARHLDQVVVQYTHKAQQHCTYVETNQVGQGNYNLWGKILNNNREIMGNSPSMMDEVLSLCEQNRVDQNNLIIL